MEHTESNASLRWSLRDIRAPLCSINETFLQLLVDVAHLPGEPASDFIADLRPDLCSLAEPIMRIAARTPILLVDMEFGDDALWKTFSVNSASVPAATWTTPFPRPRATKLARSTLMLVWHLARTDQGSSSVLMGLSASVIEIVGALQPEQIDRIAERQFARLKPRWEDRPSVWRHLLSATSDDKGVRDFMLRALQLTFASLPVRLG